MMGLLKKGNKVWIIEDQNTKIGISDDPKRKLKYTLQIIEDQNTKIGINTHLTNKLVLEALQNSQIRYFQNIEKIKSEVKFGDKTRFDFLVLEKEKKSFIEVKNVIEDQNYQDEKN